jgi:hypothetical protein
MTWNNRELSSGLIKIDGEATLVPEPLHKTTRALLPASAPKYREKEMVKVSMRVVELKLGSGIARPTSGNNATYYVSEYSRNFCIPRAQ